MSGAPLRDDLPPPGGSGFATTHWSVVLAAGHESSPSAREALETLCRTYWYLLYAHARRCGQNSEDAKDLVQGFFAYLLSRNALRLADPAKGRFRSYLLSSLKHFWSSQDERARAQKRGGGKPVVSLDETVAEGRYRLEPRDDWTPDRLYEREWALTLLDQARSRLQTEYAVSGRADLYERLKQFPFGEQGERSFAAASQEVGMTETALKSAVHRMRHRYQELVREVVAQTVADPSELEDEVRHLLEVLSRQPPCVMKWQNRSRTKVGRTCPQSAVLTIPGRRGGDTRALPYGVRVGVPAEPHPGNSCNGSPGTVRPTSSPGTGGLPLLGRDGSHSVPERECGRGWNASLPKWAIPIDSAVLGEPLAAGFP